jgi:hypothetical protein
MTWRWIGLLAIALVATAIVVYKAAVSGSSSFDVSIAGPPDGRSPLVLLIADPRQAEQACGCAEILQLVRAVGSRGLPVREIAPEANEAAVRKYRVVVSPTVLILDESGSEVARYEGEDRRTIEAIRTDLERLFEAER